MFMRVYIFDQELQLRVSSTQNVRDIGCSTENTRSFVTKPTASSTPRRRVTRAPRRAVGAGVEPRPWWTWRCVNHDIIEFTPERISYKGSVVRGQVNQFLGRDNAVSYAAAGRVFFY
jgi:hypothetical protein